MKTQRIKYMFLNNSRTLLSGTCSVPSCNSRSIPFYPNHVHKYPTVTMLVEHNIDTKTFSDL
jgi:hypothetical protein